MSDQMDFPLDKFEEAISKAKGEEMEKLRDLLNGED